MAKNKGIDTNKVKECLSGLSYPADKEKLIQHAQNTCGDEGVVSMLKDLPEQSYGGVQELSKVLPGGINLDLNVNI